MRQNFEWRSWEWIDENHVVCRERSLAGAAADSSRGKFWCMPGRA